MLSLWEKILIWNSSLLTLSIVNIILVMIHISQLGKGIEAYTNSILNPIIIFSFTILGILHLGNLMVTILVLTKRVWKLLLFTVGMGFALTVLYFIPVMVNGPAFVR